MLATHERARIAAGLARPRRGRLRRGPAIGGESCSSAWSRRGGPRPGAGGRLPAHPRPAEARADRRGGARDGDQARGGAAARSPLHVIARAARPAARRRHARGGGARRGLDRRGASSSPPSTASTVEGRSSAPGRSARRSSRRRREGADLIVMGSSPRWRRQSRFFSPTVDYVLRQAPCEVMVVAYPQGVLEEDGASD